MTSQLETISEPRQLITSQIGPDIDALMMRVEPVPLLKLAWGSRARELAEAAKRAVHTYKDRLTPGEVEALCHWLEFCIVNPGMWMLDLAGK